MISSMSPKTLPRLQFRQISRQKKLPRLVFRRMCLAPSCLAPLLILSFSEYDSLAKSFASGLRNVTNFSFAADPEVRHSTLRSSHLRGDSVDEMSFIELWLPESLALDILLPHVNMSLERKRETAGQARHSHRAPVDRETFINFLLRYFLESLQSKGRLKDDVTELVALKRALMGDQRFEEIRAACTWRRTTVESLYKKFNEIAVQLLFLGTVATIDETLLAYFGSDAKELRISRHFPGKPHDYGLLWYRLAVRLRHSRARVTVAMVPIIPGHSVSPTAAARELIGLVRPHQLGGPHYVMDSAFATSELMDHLHADDTAVSFSLKSSCTSDLSPIYRLATEGLEVGQVRTYLVPPYLLQARRNAKESKKGGLPLHAVLTSGWRTGVPAPIAIKRLAKYETAVFLWRTEDQATISELLNVPAIGTTRDMIKEKTQWDVLAPAPDRDGIVRWTEEALSKMYVDQLRALAQITPGCRAPSQRNATQLVADILRHHPHADRDAQPKAVQRATDKNIFDLHAQIGQATTIGAPVLDFYSAEYGLVDEINQDIYRYILLSWHRDAFKLLGFSLLHASFMNAWSCWQEAEYDAFFRNPRGARQARAHPPHVSFDRFILNAARARVAKL